MFYLSNRPLFVPAWKISVENSEGGGKKKIFFFLKLGIGSFEFFFSFFELLLNIQGVLSRLICHV